MLEVTLLFICDLGASVLSKPSDIVKSCFYKSSAVDSAAAKCTKHNFVKWTLLMQAFESYK